LLLVQIQSVTNFRKKWRNGEPDEKGNEEEIQPRAMEGSHVGTREVASLNLSGLVILLLIGIDLKGVRLVLLSALHLHRTTTTTI